MFFGLGHPGRQMLRGSAAGGGVPPGASLDLNFMQPGTLDPRIVFTRGSTATYFDSTGTLQTAAANAPRWDYDPVTHALKGLLIEESRTNNWLQSADANHGTWNKLAAIVAAPVTTPNQTAAPDGTLTAASVTLPAVSAAGSRSMLYQGVNVTASQYTFSIWMKGSVGGEQTYITHSNGSGTSASLRVTLTTAWQRFALITGALTAGGWFFEIGSDLINDPSQTATPAQTIYVWGGQVEQGAWATSYIPTTAAAVTRAADACSMPVGAWFDQTKGSMQIEYIIEGVSPGYSAPAQFVGASVDTDYIDADEATTVNATGITPTLAGAGIVIAGSGTSNCTFPNPPNPGGVVHSGASAWGIGQYMAGAHDGTLADVGYGPSASLPVITRLTIAGLMHYQTPFNLWARHMRYWPRALSPAELRSVTTVAVEAPALDLNFMSPGVLDPRVTLTRAASTATYFDVNGRMQFAATNAPRWDYDPASHVLRGLLIEDARTNIAVPSNNWGTAQPPTSSQDGVVFNVGPGLDGTNTAQAYIPGPWSGVHQSFTFFPGVSSTTYTFSTYAKNMGCPIFYMELGNTGFGSNAQAAVFDLSSGIVAQQSGNGSGVIQNVGNGWYRCSMNATTLAGSAAPYVPNIRAGHSLGEVGSVWTGNGVDAVWLWGMQVEVGAYATSHIPTTSAAATRAADVCYAAVGNWFNPVAMSVLSEFFLPYSGWGIISGSGDNNFGNALYLAANSTSSFTGGGTTAVAQSNFIPNAVNKSCWTYDLLAVQLVNNAGPLAISAYASGTQTAALRLSIGCSPWAFDNQANGHMRHISYWPRRLANTQLVAVTT